jgi:hypothetical protein
MVVVSLLARQMRYTIARQCEEHLKDEDGICHMEQSNRTGL